MRRLENQTLLAVIVAIVIAVLYPEFFLAFSFPGTVFLKLLKMVVVPLIFTSVFNSVINLRSLGAFKRLGTLTLIYYMVTTSLAVVTGLVVVNLIRPSAPVIASVPPKVKEISLESLVLGMFPENVFKSFYHSEVVPVIFFAVVLGLSAVTLKEKREVLTVKDFFEGLGQLLLVLTRAIIRLTPVGVFFIVGKIVAEKGIEPILALGSYSATVVLGLAFHAAVTLPLILFFFTRTNPWSYFLKVREAPLLAFSTASSSATLPVTLEVAKDKAKIKDEVSGFVLPLGATVNMDGTALYEAVAAMFIAFSYGLELNLYQQVLIFLTAVLASVGAAGIPSAGLVTMTLVLQSVGLPLEGIGLILAVDRFLDMLRTSVNVWGDLVGARVLDGLLPSSGRSASALV